jgi:hypothetical protein
MRVVTRLSKTRASPPAAQHVRARGVREGRGGEGLHGLEPQAHGGIQTREICACGWCELLQPRHALALTNAIGVGIGAHVPAYTLLAHFAHLGAGGGCLNGMVVVLDRGQVVELCQHTKVGFPRVDVISNGQIVGIS